MTYKTVVSSGWILPRKSKYTKIDFDKLVRGGHEPKVARFICLCSAVYHQTEASSALYGWDLVRATEYKLGLQVSR